MHGAWRVDLNGRPAGTVSEEDEAHARALLFAMQPKPPERARAEPQRVEQTLQTEQRNVPPAPRLPAKPTTSAKPAKSHAITEVRAKQMADQAERRLTKKRSGYVPASEINRRGLAHSLEPSLECRERYENENAGHVDRQSFLTPRPSGMH